MIRIKCLAFSVWCQQWRKSVYHLPDVISSYIIWAAPISCYHLLFFSILPFHFTIFHFYHFTIFTIYHLNSPTFLTLLVVHSLNFFFSVLPPTFLSLCLCLSPHFSPMSSRSCCIVNYTLPQAFSPLPHFRISTAPPLSPSPLTSFKLNAYNSFDTLWYAIGIETCIQGQATPVKHVQDENLFFHEWGFIVLANKTPFQASNASKSLFSPTLTSPSVTCRR